MCDEMYNLWVGVQLPQLLELAEVSQVARPPAPKP